MSNFEIWFRGILAALIGGASSAAAAALAAPQAFNSSHDGLIAFAKVIVIGAALPTLAYLKQSPLPAASITATTTSTVDVTKN